MTLAKLLDMECYVEPWLSSFDVAFDSIEVVDCGQSKIGERVMIEVKLPEGKRAWFAVDVTYDANGYPSYTPWFIGSDSPAVMVKLDSLVRPVSN